MKGHRFVETDANAGLACFSKRAIIPPSLDIHIKWMFFREANLQSMRHVQEGTK